MTYQHTAVSSQQVQLFSHKLKFKTELPFSNLLMNIKQETQENGTLSFL